MSAAQNGFGLDLNLCTGCGACAVACSIENELPWGSSWRAIDTFNSQRTAPLPVHHLSLACNHCEDAPCATHCPALAYHKDPDTGAVLLDSEKCIGCKYCTWACPYDAPSYNESTGVVSKCTFCQHRQEQGLAPACVSQCPTGALGFGELAQLPGQQHVPGFPRTDAKPAIRFIPLRPGTSGAPAQPSPGLSLPGAARHWPSKTSLRSEAPLWVFSLLCVFLAGVSSSPAGRQWMPWWVFCALAGLAASASTLHLGRKDRAWRAVLNWRRSWLSREILLFSAFAAIGSLELLGLLPAGVGLWLVPLSAASALFAIDMVYGVTATRGLHWHSARTLVTGLMIACLAFGSPAAFAAIALLKLAAYTARKARFLRAGRNWRPLLSAPRVLIGLVLPATLALLSREPNFWWLGLALAVGEAIDRAEFYLELEISTPARQIQLDLQRLSA